MLREVLETKSGECGKDFYTAQLRRTMSICSTLLKYYDNTCIELGSNSNATYLSPRHS
jgi:hypothetical protein